jgi:Flp pilus assembly protein TadG
MKQFRTRLVCRGQGMVEFALIIPIFLLLTLGVAEAGWLMYANHTLTNATREGARFAMVNGSRAETLADVDSVGAVIEQRAGRMSGRITTTSVEFSPDADAGSEVTVVAELAHQSIVGMIAGFGPMTLTSESTVIVQY